MDIEKAVEKMNADLATAEEKINEAADTVAVAKDRLEHAKGVVSRVMDASADKQADRVKEARELVHEIFGKPRAREAVKPDSKAVAAPPKTAPKAKTKGK